jgi:hypothetical protein
VVVAEVVAVVVVVVTVVVVVVAVVLVCGGLTGCAGMEQPVMMLVVASTAATLDR